jgi:membrane protease YdiL (CAAX protease family)
LPSFAAMNLILPNFADHVVMVIMGIVLPVFAVMQGKSEMEEMKFDTQSKVDMYFSNGLTMWVITLIISFVWFFSGRPLYEIGFQFPQFNGSLWAILTLTFILMYVGESWYEIRNEAARAATKKHLQKDIPFLPINKLELQHFAILSLTAGFCEEVIFRGYFIQYFLSFTGTSPLGQFIAVTLPGVIFALSHLYQGWKAVAKIMVLAILFGYIFLATQSIWLLVVLHFLVDFIGGYMAMKLLEE